MKFVINWHLKYIGRSSYPLLAELVGEEREVQAQVGHVAAAVRAQQQQAAVQRGVQRRQRVHVGLAAAAQLAQEELR